MYQAVVDKWMAVLVAVTLPALGLAVAVGAAAQPASFGWTHESISAAAALDARHRDLTTAAMAGAGILHLVVAAFLRRAAFAGRALLAATALFMLLTAAFPLPTGGRWSIAHAVFASLTAITMTLWPVAADRRGLLRAPAGWSVTLLLIAMCGWYVWELVLGGSRDGVAERAAVAAEMTWLAVAVRTEVRHRRRAAQALLRPAPPCQGHPEHAATLVDVVPISR